MADELRRRRDGLGVTYFAVGEAFADRFAPVVELLGRMTAADSNPGAVTVRLPDRVAVRLLVPRPPALDRRPRASARSAPRP